MQTKELKELKSRCRELEDSLYRMRESIGTAMRDYQMRYKEFEDTVAVLKDHIHGLELIVESYENSMEVLRSVLIWRK